MTIKAKRHMDRKLYMLHRQIEKFFQSVFLKVKQDINISLDCRNDDEPFYFNKEAEIKRGPFKVKINSEHRGGEKYKNFVTVYFCGIKVIETFWRTEKGNNYRFHTTGDRTIDE